MVVSTQQHIDIAGIKDGIVILKSGGYRMILSASTVNFALKSEEEQNSLIFQYQSFLNSLHFPIEILMQSRKLDLTPYLGKVTKIKEGISNELLRLQTEDYIDFVKQLINVANIMKKNFYIVIPYDPLSLGSGSIIDKLFKRGPVVSELRVPEAEFNKGKNELVERANNIASGLGGMGIRCVQLNTEEIIELFYRLYNPEIASKEQISDVNDLTSPYVGHVSEKNKDENTEVVEEAVIDNSGIIAEKQRADFARGAAKYEESKQAAESQAQPIAAQQPSEQPGIQNPALSPQPTVSQPQRTEAPSGENQAANVPQQGGQNG